MEVAPSFNYTFALFFIINRSAVIEQNGSEKQILPIYSLSQKISLCE